jgi:hypothetical protein
MASPDSLERLIDDVPVGSCISVIMVGLCESVNSDVIATVMVK